MCDDPKATSTSAPSRKWRSSHPPAAFRCLGKLSSEYPSQTKFLFYQEWIGGNTPPQVPFRSLKKQAALALYCSPLAFSPLEGGGRIGRSKALSFGETRGKQKKNGSQKKKCFSEVPSVSRGILCLIYTVLLQLLLFLEAYQ